MSDIEGSAPGAQGAELVQLRPIAIDDWSAVRYVHGRAFSTLVGPHVSPAHTEEFLASLDSPGYADHLGGSNLTGVWVNGVLAGTVGWRPSASQGRVARIEGLFVQPLFTFMGLGTLLMDHAEEAVCRAGFDAVTVLSAPVSVPFFLRLGYDVYLRGAGIAQGPSDLLLFLMRKQEGDLAQYGGLVTDIPLDGLASASEAHTGAMRGATPEPVRVLVED